MEDQIFYWLSFFIFLVIFEIGKTKKNLRLAIIISALVPVVVSFCGFKFDLQLAAFVLSTAVTYFVLRSLENKNKIDNNFELLELHGKRGIVTEPLTPFKYGFVKIDGHVCPAQSLRNTSIEVGALVEVIGASSCHIVVEKIHEY